MRPSGSIALGVEPVRDDDEVGREALERGHDDALEGGDVGAAAAAARERDVDVGAGARALAVVLDRAREGGKQPSWCSEIVRTLGSS